MAIQEEVTMSINDPTPDAWDKARNRKACDTVASWTQNDYDPVTQRPRKTYWTGEEWTVGDDDYNTTTFGPLEGRGTWSQGGFKHAGWKDESVTPVENPKAAIGAAKAPFFGIPWTAVIEMGTVMDGGAHKYGAYNYRDTRISTTTYHDAILRHFMLWADGEDNDPESKSSHLAHIMACCALMIDADVGCMLEDDRSVTGSVRWMLDNSAKTAREFRNGEG
jgi:hypothetical protein